MWKPADVRDLRTPGGWPPMTSDRAPAEAGDSHQSLAVGLRDLEVLHGLRRALCPASWGSGPGGLRRRGWVWTGPQRREVLDVVLPARRASSSSISISIRLRTPLRVL